MVFSAEVEVLSVNQVTDVLTGGLAYQIGLGRTGKPSKEFDSALKVKRISSNVLIINLPTKGECPYRAGSKWLLRISDSGEVTLKEKRGAETN
jgi:hypothetical protein